MNWSSPIPAEPFIFVNLPNILPFDADCSPDTTFFTRPDTTDVLVFNCDDVGDVVIITATAIDTGWLDK